MGNDAVNATSDEVWNLLKEVWPEIDTRKHDVCAASLRCEANQLPVLIVERYIPVQDIERIRKYIERWEVKLVTRERAHPPEGGYQADVNEVVASG